MIRVVIADDHQVVRVGLEQLLQTFDDVEFLGSGAGGEQAVALCEQHRPDVLLLDLSMPDLDGIEVTKRLRDSSPDTKVVVFTSFSDRERIVQALDAGAVGYLLKDAEPEELHAAVQAASRGEAPLTPRAAAALLAAPTRSAGRGRLTARERECSDWSSTVWRTADRPPHGHQREDREGPPDEPLPAHRGRRPHPGGAVGRAYRRLRDESGEGSRDRSPVVRARRPRTMESCLEPAPVPSRLRWR